jgi:hypothetical protein
VIAKHGWNTHKGSSHIDSSKYDNDARTLDIKFQNGSVYRYHGVPPGEHLSFLAASSQGEHFSKFIKGQYEFEQVK